MEFILFSDLQSFQPFEVKMDEENIPAVDDQTEGGGEFSNKKVRRRKKTLYKNIRNQMEFYFSDANVTKDRFLGKLIQEDPSKQFFFI